MQTLRAVVIARPIKVADFARRLVVARVENVAVACCTVVELDVSVVRQRRECTRSYFDVLGCCCGLGAVCSCRRRRHRFNRDCRCRRGTVSKLHAATHERDHVRHFVVGVVGRGRPVRLEAFGRAGARDTHARVNRTCKLGRGIDCACALDCGVEAELVAAGNDKRYALVQVVDGFGCRFFHRDCLGRVDNREAAGEFVGRNRVELRRAAEHHFCRFSVVSERAVADLEALRAAGAVEGCARARERAATAFVRREAAFCLACHHAPGRCCAELVSVRVQVFIVRVLVHVRRHKRQSFCPVALELCGVDQVRAECDRLFRALARDLYEVGQGCRRARLPRNRRLACAFIRYRRIRQHELEPVSFLVVSQLVCCRRQEVTGFSRARRRVGVGARINRSFLADLRSCKGSLGGVCELVARLRRIFVEFDVLFALGCAEHRRVDCDCLVVRAELDVVGQRLRAVGRPCNFHGAVVGQREGVVCLPVRGRAAVNDEAFFARADALVGLAVHDGRAVGAARNVRNVAAVQGHHIGVRVAAACLDAEFFGAVAIEIRCVDSTPVHHDFAVGNLDVTRDFCVVAHESRLELAAEDNRFGGAVVNERVVAAGV